jgi:hypothetical protein
MTNNILTSNEIVETIERSIEFHLAEAEKLKAMLAVLNTKAAVLKASNGVAKTSQSNNAKTTIDVHVKEMVEVLNKADRPLMSSQLMEHFNKGKKRPLKKGSIGAILSEAGKKNLLKNVMFNYMENGRRNWWVSPRWIDSSGELKKDYLEKINP